MPRRNARPVSIGVELERQRLEHRARRVERVLGVLRARRGARVRAGVGPGALDGAIADFGSELTDLRVRLRHVR